MTDHRYILDVRVDATTSADAVARVLSWAGSAESRYVCAANVHVVMEAHDSPAFLAVVNAADLVTPDGMPLVWMLRRLGARGAQHVRGPDLTLSICAAAQAQRVPVGFYGGLPERLRNLVEMMHARFPSLEIAYAYAPPFRPLSRTEDEEISRRVEASGARILFVGLGCPKQEWWMAQHRGRMRTVMVGVGAAFQMHAGLVRQAPVWMQAAGLEWVFRLWSEPRLWSRYLKHNPRFAALAAMQALGWRRSMEVEG